MKKEDLEAFQALDKVAEAALDKAEAAADAAQADTERALRTLDAAFLRLAEERNQLRLNEFYAALGEVRSREALLEAAIEEETKARRDAWMPGTRGR